MTVENLTNYNPVLFDTQTGAVLYPEDPFQDRATPAHIVPLAKIVFAENFPYKNGDFDQVSTACMTPDEAVIAGQGIARIYITPFGQKPFGREDLRRLYILGILPDINYVRRHYGKLRHYCKFIGVETNRSSNHFDGLSPPELFDLVIRTHIEASPDSPITTEELELYYWAGILPAYDFIRRRTGGITELNDYIGFPDIRKWDDFDYRTYGARVLEANGAGSLTARNINRLAAKRLGPSMPPIIERYNRLSIYQKLAEEELLLRRANQKTHDDTVSTHFQKIAYAGSYGDNERSQIWAKYQLTQVLFPATDPHELIALSLAKDPDFMRILSGMGTKITLATIETTALSLGLDAYIWPPKYTRSLKLPQ